MRRAMIGGEVNGYAAFVERDSQCFRRKQMTAGATGREQDQLFCVTCGHGHTTVMSGLVPGIHVFRLDKQNVDGTRNSGLPELRKRLNKEVASRVNPTCDDIGV
jgi:hypothetical protein